MLEGSVFVAGAVVQWLRDGLGLFARSDDVEALARQVDDHGDVFLVPGFAGLGAPHWDPDARGAIVGLTRGTTEGAYRARRAAIDRIPVGRCTGSNAARCAAAADRSPSRRRRGKE